MDDCLEDKEEEGFNETIKLKLQEIKNIWQKLGLPNNVLIERKASLMHHIEDLLDNMITEEEHRLQRNKTSCKSRIEQITWLAAKLNLPTNIPDKVDSLYEYEILLRNRQNELETIHNERLIIFSQLKEEKTILSKFLNKNPTTKAEDMDEAGNKTSAHVPNDEEINNLKNSNNELKLILIERDNDLQNLSSEIQHYFQELNIDYDKETNDQENIKNANDYSISLKHYFDVVHFLKEFSSPKMSKDEKSALVLKNNEIKSIYELFSLEKWYSDGMMDSLKLSSSIFANAVEKQREEIDEKLSLIHSYWRRLNIEDDVQESFNEKINDFQMKLDKNQLESSKELLNFLNDQLLELEELKKARAPELIACYRNELINLINRCFLPHFDFDSLLMTPTFHISPSKCSSLVGGKIDYLKMLTEFEEEIQRVNDYYNENQAILDAANHWTQNFNEFLEYEAEMKNPANLQNRGGRLLQLERNIKRCRQKLKKSEFDLNRLAENPQNNQVLLLNKPVQEYVQLRWKDYNENKKSECNDRATRQKKRVLGDHDSLNVSPRPLKMAKNSSVLDSSSCLSFIGSPRRNKNVPPTDANFSRSRNLSTYSLASNHSARK